MKFGMERGRKVALEEKIEQLTSVPLNKQRPCYFYNHGGCKWGDSCSFAHKLLDEQERSARVKPGSDKVKGKGKVAGLETESTAHGAKGNGKMQVSDEGNGKGNMLGQRSVNTADKGVAKGVRWNRRL